MKFTTERKVYAAILGLGVLALGADRVFFGGGTLSPGSAAAASFAVEQGFAPIADEKQVSPAPAENAAPPLAARLESVRPESGERISVAEVFLSNVLVQNEETVPLHKETESPDLFSSSAGWLVSSETRIPPHAPQPVEPVTTIKDVLANHRITTLVASRQGSQSFVVVDGKRLTPGQSFSGVTIVSIEKSEVTFEYNGEVLKKNFARGEDQ